MDDELLNGWMNDGENAKNLISADWSSIVPSITLANERSHRQLLYDLKTITLLIKRMIYASVLHIHISIDG